MNILVSLRESENAGDASKPDRTRENVLTLVEIGQSWDNRGIEIEPIPGSPFLQGDIFLMGSRMPGIAWLAMTGVILFFQSHLSLVQAQDRETSSQVSAAKQLAARTGRPILAIAGSNT